MYTALAPSGIEQKKNMISDRLSSRPHSHGHFVWYELMTTDMEAAKAFYAQVIGWGTQDAAVPAASYTVFTAAGVSVSGALRVPEEAIKSGFRPTWLGYVGVDDVDAAAGRVAQLGGARHVTP